jgi:hypothetical protein
LPFERRDRILGAFRIRKQTLPGLCESVTAWSACRKLAANPHFQIEQPPVNRGLAGPEHAGCRERAATTGDGEKFLPARRANLALPEQAIATYRSFALAAG